MLRNFFKYVNYNDLKKFSADVKNVYNACNQRVPTDGFAEQNGRDAERADLTYIYY